MGALDAHRAAPDEEERRAVRPFLEDAIVALEAPDLGAFHQQPLVVARQEFHGRVHRGLLLRIA
jgi:hypothetical protein